MSQIENDQHESLFASFLSFSHLSSVTFTDFTAF